MTCKSILNSSGLVPIILNTFQKGNGGWQVNCSVQGCVCCFWLQDKQMELKSVTHLEKNVLCLSSKSWGLRESNNSTWHRQVYPNSMLFEDSMDSSGSGTSTNTHVQDDLPTQNMPEWLWVNIVLLSPGCLAEVAKLISISFRSIARRIFSRGGLFHSNCWRLLRSKFFFEIHW